MVRDKPPLYKSGGFVFIHEVWSYTLGKEASWPKVLPI
jgi:hypothetical protein